MNFSTCRLAPFYAVPTEFVFHESQIVSSLSIYTKWSLNLKNIHYLASIIRTHRSDFRLPDDLNLHTIDRYLIQQLASSPDLGDRVVNQLYQLFRTQPLDPASHQIWVNFINYMELKLASHLWHRLPRSQRTEARFDLFRSLALFHPSNLFTHNFDPGYDDDLLNGINRWTYRVLSNAVASKIRNVEPFFGLSDLGILRKASMSIIHDVLCNDRSTEQLDIDKFLVRIFKEYVKRSQIPVDRIEASDWVKIDRECHRQWHRLKQDLPPPSTLEIQNRLKSIGKQVRYFDRPLMDSLDRSSFTNKSSSILTSQEDKSQLLTVESIDDRQSWRAEWLQANDLLLQTISSTISTLQPIDLEILQLKFRDGLKQEDIELIIGKDQATISRKLRKIIINLLVKVHERIPHPDDSIKKITPEAIAAMKEALTIFFRSPS